MFRLKKIIKFLIFLIILVGVGIVGLKYGMNVLFPTQYSEYVEKYSTQYNLDKYLVYSIIKAESGFDSQAISPREAKGLMQVMDSTGEWVAGKINLKDFKPEMLLNPETNINIGTWYISYLLDKYDNNIDLATAAYNAGSGNVSKWLNDPEKSSDGQSLDTIPFPETDNYVSKVRKFYKIYKMLYENGN